MYVEVRPFRLSRPIKEPSYYLPETNMLQTSQPLDTKGGKEAIFVGYMSAIVHLWFERLNS